MLFVGAWPWWIRSAAAAALFSLVMGGGYFGFLSDRSERLNSARSHAAQLRHDYDREALRAAGLQTRQQGSAPQTGATSALVQMPGNADIPPLIEGISQAAEYHGLVVRGIDLAPERLLEQYAELPLKISVRGGYHDIGAFVSAVAGMARLVTLHDFDLELAEATGSVGAVRMNVLAKAYRHLRPDADFASWPPLEKIERYPYRAADRRSPLEPSMPGDAAPQSGSAAPNLARPRQYLEHRPIDALAVVGLLSDGAARYALVRDEAGRVHRVGAGHYLGEDHGRVREVTPVGIDFVEIIPDGAGGWVQRARTLSLSYPAPGMNEDRRQ